MTALDRTRLIGRLRIFY